MSDLGLLYIGITLVCQLYLPVQGIDIVSAENDFLNDLPAKSMSCVDMIKVESDLKYIQGDETRSLCGVYFISNPDELVSIEITKAKLDCDGSEFIEIFDGWMARNNLLPSESDHVHNIAERLVNYCTWNSDNIKKTFQFVSSQNTALLQYRLHQNSGLAIRFRRIKSNQPLCNIVSPSNTGDFLWQSSGKRNCTFSMIQPTLLTVARIQLGAENGKNKKTSAIEILKGDSLNVGDMTVIERFKSPFHFEGTKKFALDRSHSAIRMTSSEQHENLISFSYSKMSVEESVKAEICN